MSGADVRVGPLRDFFLCLFVGDLTVETVSDSMELQPVIRSASSPLTQIIQPTPLNRANSNPSSLCLFDGSSQGVGVVGHRTRSGPPTVEPLPNQPCRVSSERTQENLSSPNHAASS